MRYYSFGGGHRDDHTSKANINAPGPGAYHIMDRIGREGSKFSIAGRPKVEINESIKVPGPAAYDIKQRGMGGGYKFGTSGNSSVGSGAHIGSNSNPGPGKYDVRTRYKNFKQSAPAWKYHFIVTLEWVQLKGIN